MNRKVIDLSALLVATLLLSACAGAMGTVRHGAEEALRNTLVFHFGRQFAYGMGFVIQGLAREGGYLDNPLVRILLPPPVGLVIDVARDLRHDPKAALLETLMNRAAENAIPGAGPILQAALRDMDRSDTRSLFAAGKTATTDYLRERVGAAVYEALRPVIAQELAVSGAVDVYQGLLQEREREIAMLVAEAPERMQRPVAPENLDDYVTGRAVDGLFRMLEQRETLIRETMVQMPTPAGSPR
jgi:hypothetical protein